MVLCAFHTVSKTSAVKIHNGKGLKGSSGHRRNWLPNCHPAVHTGHCAYCSTLYDCENWYIYKLSHCTYLIKCGLTIQKFCEIFEGFHFEVLTVIDTACQCVIFKTVHMTCDRKCFTYFPGGLSTATLLSQEGCCTWRRRIPCPEYTAGVWVQPDSCHSCIVSRICELCAVVIADQWPCSSRLTLMAALTMRIQV